MSVFFAFVLMEKRERERAVCFTLPVFLVSCDSQCSVGWSVVCDCSIS